MNPHSEADPGLLVELEDLAVELARGAGSEIRERMSDEFRVSMKSTPTDLVTQVDRHVEQWLVDRIAARRPNDAVLGEEGAERPGTTAVRWVLDPIDGTVNFVLGLPQYAVSVAAELAGKAVVGAVFNPATGELYRARRGGGAWLGDVRLSGPRSVGVERSVVGTGFGYDARRRAAQIGVVAELLPRIADIRRLGAASLDICSVASGRLDAYFEVGLNRWDYAAGLVIAEEAGCVSSGLHGDPPGPRMTAVAGADRAAAFFALLEDVGADRVSR